MKSKRLQIFQKLSDENKNIQNRTLELAVTKQSQERIKNLTHQIGEVASFVIKDQKCLVTYFDSRHSKRAMSDLALFSPQFVQNEEFSDDVLLIEGAFDIQQVKQMLHQYGDINKIKENHNEIMVQFYDTRAAVKARNEHDLILKCLREKIIDFNEIKNQQQEKENYYIGYPTMYECAEPFKEQMMMQNIYQQPLYEINYNLYDPIIAMLPPRQTSICRNENYNSYQIDIRQVMNGYDNRQAIMIKNIPNKYNQYQLLEEITGRMKAHWNISDFFDFFYLPIDFSNNCNVGYAFINFKNTELIINFYMEFVGKHWQLYNSQKICQLTYARVQGQEALIRHFQSSNVMKVRDERLKPIICQ